MSSPNSDACVTRRKIQLQGPRPASLMIGAESQKIQKGPKKPVIIYMVSPKIIHVHPSEFMALVQRLTGVSSSPAVADEKPSETSGSSTVQYEQRGQRQFPVKVKARSLTRSGSESAERGMSIQRATGRSPISPTFFLHELSPLSEGGADHHRKGSELASPSWFLHGDLVGQPGEVAASHTFLDIFSHAQEQQNYKGEF